jgi:hypothetical protein
MKSISGEIAAIKEREPCSPNGTAVIRRDTQILSCCVAREVNIGGSTLHD